jgi:hypothetical protein
VAWSTLAKAAPPEVARPEPEPEELPAKEAVAPGERPAAQAEKVEARGPAARVLEVRQAQAELVQEARRVPVVRARVEAVPMPAVTSMLVEGVMRATHRLTAAPTARRLLM